jgi:hypothetical protein
MVDKEGWLPNPNTLMIPNFIYLLIYGEFDEVNGNYKL